MADTTKLMLSAGELQFAQDTSWVLTKRRITDVVYELFSAQVAVITNTLGGSIAAQDPVLARGQPKISKGENYRQLPYVMLDYPATFMKENVFAIRTMFWWGNFVSITLHVSGSYANGLRKNITRELLRDAGDLYLCVNEAEWEHHFEADNYLRVAAMDATKLQNLVHASPFIKLALKYNLAEWDLLPGLMEAGYKQMAGILAG